MSASSYLIMGIVQMLHTAGRARKETNLKERRGARENRNVLPFWRLSQHSFLSTEKRIGHHVQRTCIL